MEKSPVLTVQAGEELIRLRSSAPWSVQKSRLCTLAHYHSTTVHTLYGHSWFNSKRKRACYHPFPICNVIYLFLMNCILLDQLCYQAHCLVSSFFIKSLLPFQLKFTNGFLFIR